MKATGKLATGRADAVTRASTARGNRPEKKDRVTFRSFVWATRRNLVARFPGTKSARQSLVRGTTRGQRPIRRTDPWLWPPETIPLCRLVAYPGEGAGVDIDTLDRKLRNELWRLVFRLARAASGSRTRAKDLTQKTFLRLATTSPWTPGKITLGARRSTS